MLSRFILNPTRHLRLFTRTLSSHLHPSASVFQIPHSQFASPSQIPNFVITQLFSRHFSSNNDDNSENGQEPTSDFWKITPENDNFESVFGNEDGGLTGISELGNEEGELKPQESSWATAESGDGEGDVFQGDDKEVREKESGGSVDDWLTMEGFKTWNLKEEEKVEDVFDIGDVGGQAQVGSAAEHGLEKEKEKTEDDLQLQKEEEALMVVLKGPNRTFGDLVAASGITDAMLDSLIALKDFQTIDGLPPLTEIEEKSYENSLKKSSRYEMELQKQEEAAKARVRQVDEKGRAYGTGRRKCSIARVWIQPGEGKFLVNDKEFDVYFPMLDHRAALLQPFSETQTLGLWDIKCTVEGGGVSGQVGAIRLGISRALQNWEPGFRPQLREAGFLTRDPRVVERKKPGKAKARKSFQWVKR